METDATSLANKSQHYWVLHVAADCTPCYVMLHRVWNRSNSWATNSQHFLSRVAQHCWIRLHSSSNIVGAAHAHFSLFTKSYGLYSSHDALWVPPTFGIIASICRPLPKRTQQLPTLLAQQCWRFLRPFVRSLSPWFGFRDGQHFKINQDSYLKYIITQFSKTIMPQRMQVWNNIL